MTEEQGDVEQGAGDTDYAAFLETWKHYADAKRETHEQLDTWLLKLSAGALALSLAPATKLFERGGPQWILVLAWFLFGTAIGATVWSMLASARRTDAMAKRAFRTIVKREPLEDDEHVTQGVRRVNNVAMAAFLVGLVLGLVYVATVFVAQG
jgi:membrane associated rhomboid family serine protease